MSWEDLMMLIGMSRNDGALGVPEYDPNNASGRPPSPIQSPHGYDWNAKEGFRMAPKPDPWAPFAFTSER